MLFYNSQFVYLHGISIALSKLDVYVFNEFYNNIIKVKKIVHKYFTFTVSCTNKSCNKDKYI